MHNIDRNMLESNYETGPFETGQFEYTQFEGPFANEYAQESNEFGFETEAWPGEAESYEGESYEGESYEGESYEGESYETFGSQSEVTFNESEEMELAAELLEVSNEQELEQFLGKLVRKAARAAGSFVKSPAGKALGGVLKGLAKKALPIAGTALGGFVGGPLGAKIGQGLASAAGRSLGLESETFSNEDREFEGARQFVRIAGQTARHMSTARRGDPRFAARQAMLRAVRRNAPGLLQPSSYGDYGQSGSVTAGGRRQSGRWMRRGNRIILLGV